MLVQMLQNLRGLGGKLLFEVCDLGLERGDGGLGLGTLGSLQLGQLRLQLLVLSLQQHLRVLKLLNLCKK